MVRASTYQCFVNRVATYRASLASLAPNEDIIFFFFQKLVSFMHEVELLGNDYVECFKMDKQTLLLDKEDRDLSSSPFPKLCNIFDQDISYIILFF